MTSLQQPQGIDDTTPLPYELWQVVSLVDGHMSLTEVARLSGLEENEVTARLARVDAYVQQHQRLSRPIDDELYGVLGSTLGKVVGPVAPIILEDAVSALGGRESQTVGTLLRRVSAELDEEQRRRFMHTARGAELL